MRGHLPFDPLLVIVIVCLAVTLTAVVAFAGTTPSTLGNGGSAATAM